MKKALYNPLATDFVVKYDINGDMKPVEINVPSMAISYFEEPLFSHVRKHLIDDICNSRNINTTLKEDVKEVEEEVDVVV